MPVRSKVIHPAQDSRTVQSAMANPAGAQSANAQTKRAARFAFGHASQFAQELAIIFAVVAFPAAVARRINSRRAAQSIDF